MKQNTASNLPNILERAFLIVETEKKFFLFLSLLYICLQHNPCEWLSQFDNSSHTMPSCVHEKEKYKSHTVKGREILGVS